MRRKKRTGILTFLVFLIFVFSMVVWASDGIEGERMDTEDTETERVIRESEGRESQIQEESEGIAGETFTENGVETETGIEDSYVYDGEVFSEVNEYSARAVTKGKIDYTYWAIHQGAGFGNILEDGRDLDHVGCIMLKVGNTWKTAYCVHHNADLKGGHEYADTASYLTDSNKKRLTGLALYYGFRFSGWNPDKKTVPGDSDKGKYTATQVMIWMIERGWYTYDANTYAFQLNTKAINAAKKICDKSDQSPVGSSYDYFKTIYSKMQTFGTVPSFTYRSENSAQVRNMGYDFQTNQYVLKLTDTNNVLSMYDVSEVPNGVTAQKTGNTLNLYSSIPITSAGVIKLSKKSFKAENAVTVWSDQTISGYQQIGTYKEPETADLNTYLKITAQSVTMTAEKVWNDSDNIYGKRPSELMVDLYRGQSKGDKAVLVKTVILNAENEWQFTVSDLPQKDSAGGHIYYMFTERETAGYTAETTESTAGTRHWKFTFTNTLNSGHLQLLKKSSDEALTGGNPCYTLLNAEYGVYTDRNCTSSVGDLITGESGWSNTLTSLAAGTYYVKERKKPSGYRIDDAVHEVMINEGETTVITLTDEPIISWGQFRIEKSALDGASVSDTIPLTGAEFTIDYYRETGVTKENISDKVPLKTWVVAVKKTFDGQNTSYKAELEDTYLIAEKSDELFRDRMGKAVLPLGTIAIRETKAAEGYLLQGYVDDADGRRLNNYPGESVIINLADDGESASFLGEDGLKYSNPVFRVTNELHKCSIQIMKSSADGKPLENVIFGLYDESRQKILESQTSQDGRIIFSELLPGKYWLKEEKTGNGQQLLKEPMEIVLPMVLTEQDVEKLKIDKSQLVYDENQQVFKLYDRIFEISNAGNLVLPMTGGDGLVLFDILLLAAALLLLIGVCLFVYRKGKTTAR